MGKQFGNLGVKIRGMLYYSLSPHELKPFAGAITKGLPNMIPRIMGRFVTWFFPFLAGTVTYFGVNAAHKSASRKNWRKDFADEVDPAAENKDEKTVKK